MEYVYIYLVDKNRLAGKLAKYHGNGKSPFSVGNTSSEGPFSIAMLVYQKVSSPMHPSWVIKDSLIEITHSHDDGLS